MTFIFFKGVAQPPTSIWLLPVLRLVSYWLCYVTQQEVELITSAYVQYVLAIELLKHWCYVHNNALIQCIIYIYIHRYIVFDNSWLLLFVLLFVDRFHYHYYHIILVVLFLLVWFLLLVYVHIHVSWNLLYTSFCFNHDTSHHATSCLVLMFSLLLYVWLYVYNMYIYIIYICIQL